MGNTSSLDIMVSSFYQMFSLPESRVGHGHSGAVTRSARAGIANSTSNSSPKRVKVSACL